MDTEADCQVRRLPSMVGSWVTTFGEDSSGELYSGGMDGIVRRLHETGSWEHISMPMLLR